MGRHMSQSQRNKNSRKTPRTRVNKGKEEGPGLLDPGPSHSAAPPISLEVRAALIGGG